MSKYFVTVNMSQHKFDKGKYEEIFVPANMIVEFEGEYPSEADIKKFREKGMVVMFMHRLADE